MKKKLIIPVLFLLIPLLLQAQNPSRKTSTALLQMLLCQQQAWNNGDIEAYMEYYWKSDSLRFITKNGITMGWKNTLEGYRKHYPDKESMGKLTFSNITLIAAGSRMVLVIGKWQLSRNSDSPGGYFSLLCRKFGKVWRIVADHTS